MNASKKLNFDNGRRELTYLATNNRRLTFDDAPQDEGETRESQVDAIRV